MWRVVYRELRAVTNDATLALNPMELNDIYDHLWDVGTLLTSEDSLTILEEGFRPWPKINHGTEESWELLRYPRAGQSRRSRRFCTPYLS